MLTLVSILLVWNGHSCPLPLTLILNSPVPSKKWVPHLSRPLRKVGTANPCSVVPGVDFARVERTLLSVAFDVGLAFDFEGFVSGYALQSLP